MPRQPPPVATDDEINKLLKSNGYDPKTGQRIGGAPAEPGRTAPSEAQAAPAEDTGPGVMSAIGNTLFNISGMDTPTPGRAPTYEEMGWQGRLGQGAMREMARLGVGAGRLIGKLSPSLGDYAERVPGVKRMEEFADAPAEGGWEYPGMALGDIAAAGLVPGGAAGRIASAIPRVPTFVRGAGFVPRMTKTAQVLSNPTVQKAAGAVETLGKGAAGGAIMNPDDPVRGAEFGAGGAVAGGALGKALTSRFGSNLGGTLARYLPAGVAAALLHHFGASELGSLGGGAVAHGITHSIRGYHTPAGSLLHRLGSRGTRKAGQAAKELLPGGIEGGKVSKENLSEDERRAKNLVRPQVDVPRRPFPGEENASP